MTDISKLVTFHDELNIAVINGVQVSGELLLAFTEMTERGKWFRVVNRADGVVTVETRFDDRLQ